MPNIPRVGGEDLILRAQIAEKRMRGWTLHRIGREYDVKPEDLIRYINEWVRESLGLDDGAAAALLDLATARYEAIIAKLYPEVVDGDVTDRKFAAMTKLLLEVMAAQLKVIAPRAMTGTGDGDPPYSDLAGEAERLGISVGDPDRA